MRYLISIVVWAICLACTTSSPESKNLQHVTSMFDAFNRHDWRSMAKHYAADARFLDPSLGQEYVVQSEEAIVKKYSEMESMFPNIHDEITGMYASGDKVTVEFVSTGTSTDGTSFRLPICCVLTLVGDRIVTDATYYDM